MSMEEGVQMQRRETEQKRTNEIRKRYLREKKKRSVHNRPGSAFNSHLILAPSSIFRSTKSRRRNGIVQQP